MRRSVDDDQVPVPPSDDAEDLIAVNWALSVCDDYLDALPRIQLTMEEVGRAGTGMVAHLDPDRARRLRVALASALKEIGADTGR